MKGAGKKQSIFAKRSQLGSVRTEVLKSQGLTESSNLVDPPASSGGGAGQSRQGPWGLDETQGSERQVLTSQDQTHEMRRSGQRATEKTKPIWRLAREIRENPEVTP